MLLATLLTAILVSLMAQLIDGNQRLVYVSESIDHDENFYTSGSGDNNLMCCLYRTVLVIPLIIYWLTLLVIP